MASGSSAGTCRRHSAATSRRTAPDATASDTDSAGRSPPPERQLEAQLGQPVASTDLPQGDVAGRRTREGCRSRRREPRRSASASRSTGHHTRCSLDLPAQLRAPRVGRRGRGPGRRARARRAPASRRSSPPGRSDMGDGTRALIALRRVDSATGSGGSSSRGGSSGSLDRAQPVGVARLVLLRRVRQAGVGRAGPGRSRARVNRRTASGPASGAGGIRVLESTEHVSTANGPASSHAAVIRRTSASLRTGADAGTGPSPRPPAEHQPVERRRARVLVARHPPHDELPLRAGGRDVELAQLLARVLLGRQGRRLALAPAAADVDAARARRASW